jgi:hypothetical protein
MTGFCLGGGFGFTGGVLDAALALALADEVGSVEATAGTLEAAGVDEGGGGVGAALDAAVVVGSVPLPVVVELPF